MFNDLQAHKVIGGGTAEPPIYTRPAQWLPLPEVTASDEKIVALIAVRNTYTNPCSFIIEGDYTIDWGDGTIENYNSGDQAVHFHQWDDIPQSTEITTNPTDIYRQVIVTITPQQGSLITSADINPSIDLQYQQPNAFLDIALSLPYVTYLVGYDLLTLEKLSIYNIQSLVNLQFSYLTAVKDVSIENANSLTNLSSCFITAYSMKRFFMSGATSLINIITAFANCYALRSIEIRDLNSFNGSNFSSGIIGSCRLIENIKLTGLSQLDKSSLYSLLYDIGMDKGDVNITLEDLSQVDSLTDPNLIIPRDNPRLTGKLTLTGLTALTSLSDAFSNTFFNEITLSGLDNVTSAYYAFSYCNYLTKVTLTGTQNITDWDGCFYDCDALEFGPELDTSSALFMNDMFSYCYALKSIPSYDTSNVTEMRWMLYDCESLSYVPALDTSSCVALQGFVSYCYALVQFPYINTSSCTTMSEMFYACESLSIVPSLDVSSVLSFSYIFGSTSLSKGALQGTIEHISYENSPLSRQALIDIFNGLGIVTNKIIYISGTLGVNDLTQSDLDIAINKGWTVAT